MHATLRIPMFLVVGAVIASAGGCDPIASSDASATPASDRSSPPPVDADIAPAPADTGTLADAPLAAPRAELLELAFETASKMIYEKDRARDQALVIDAWLRLDQPRRAAAAAESVSNWRRGLAHADIAAYAAAHGSADEARRLLERAIDAADSSDDWRRDRVRVRVAQVHVMLDEPEQAARFGADAPEAEQGRLESARAEHGRSDEFESQMTALEAIATGEVFDPVRNAVGGLVTLFDRYYEDAARRERIADAVRDGWRILPALLRIELVASMAETALRHDDPVAALELVTEARAMYDGHRWDLEYGLPIEARLAGLRGRAGEPERAVLDLETALRTYEARRGKDLQSFEQAETLQPVAEAYADMGRPERAVDVYRRVVEEAIVNPNARTRCDDLVAACVSMALHDVEPDEALWKSLREKCEGLDHPW